MATKRPMSAPKANDVTTTIPRIVLDDRGSSGDTPSSRPSTLTPHPATANGPGVTSSSSSAVAVEAGKESPEGGAVYIPHRCNSDIGLPTASMPNLTLALTLGEDGGGGGGRGKLGVYCSPRTTRRSVDLDVSSRGDPTVREEYDWLEDRTATLHVLSASSRVGSALSLNSVCTAHSVGLLSNDSEDDDYQDASIHDSSISEGAQGSDRVPGGAQLRRLQSYPEEDHSAPNDAGVSPRTSHSLCNLKAAQAGPAVVAESRARAAPPEPELTPEKLSLLPSDLDECAAGRHPSHPEPAERRERREVVKGGARQKVGGSREDVKKVHMVSYATSANAMREGRIRRWLEDMDKAS